MALFEEKILENVNVKSMVTQLSQVLLMNRLSIYQKIFSKMRKVPLFILTRCVIESLGRWNLFVKLHFFGDFGLVFCKSLLGAAV